MRKTLTLAGTLAVVLVLVLPILVEREAAAAEQKLTGSVVFQIGTKEYFVDNQTPGVKMDAAPMVQNGRTHVPVRFLANALGVDSDNINTQGNKVSERSPGMQALEPETFKAEVSTESRYSKVIRNAQGQQFSVYLHAPGEITEFVTDVVEAWPECPGIRYRGDYYFWLEGPGLPLTLQDIDPIIVTFGASWDGVRVLSWVDSDMPDLLLVFDRLLGNNRQSVQAFYVDGDVFRPAQFVDKWGGEPASGIILNWDALWQTEPGRFETVDYKTGGAGYSWKFIPDAGLIVCEKVKPPWMKNLTFEKGSSVVREESWGWTPGEPPEMHSILLPEPARIVDGHMMVPLRFLEGSGPTRSLDYEPDKQEVKFGIRKSDFPSLYDDIVLRIGANQATASRLGAWTGREYLVETVELNITPAPRIENGTTLVPVRFFAEILGQGLDVNWDGQRKIVTIQ